MINNGEKPDLNVTIPRFEGVLSKFFSESVYRMEDDGALEGVFSHAVSSAIRFRDSELTIPFDHRSPRVGMRVPYVLTDLRVKQDGHKSQKFPSPFE